MARSKQDFQSIRSEGGLLPSDLLARVLDSNSRLDGLKPSDYGLAKSERLNEIITQSWSRLQKHREDFREAAAHLPEGEAATGLTNEKWSLPLLRELGFGILPTTAGPAIDGRTYPISRFLGPVPIHLVGCGLSLDRRARGQRGAASLNPHGLVQEYLNRSDEHLWAITSNGLQLRILRDNQSLSRQSYLEFDLEAMFDGEIFSDFVLLWLTGHATRFIPSEGQRPESCRLEQWTQEAEQQGTRALGDLRVGVEKALQILGEGFTSHPRNTTLRDKLRSGELTLTDFHGQLLRVVYRLIFLFVAEDRTLDGQPLLHPIDPSDKGQLARKRFADYYSGARMRDMASQIKGSRHGDLWRQFQLLVCALSGDEKTDEIRMQLALPALGSFLWSPDSTAALNKAEITNYDYLEAIRHLAFTRQGKVLRPVDYRNLGAEELGGIYEGLLALTPQVSADGARFFFTEFAGSQRKTSGSYYTPDSLVQCVLDSALDPVVEQAIEGKKGRDAEDAILSLKVCDPAVGSGHFLVGAAHRLARHLARVRANAEGESEPSPLLYQHALRDVIGRCLYGVDLNPMAAELCRVSLWLEALEPGKPLSFLDHHIRVGNSLLGTNPELISSGIPDEAFKSIKGDDKSVCTQYRRQNKQEREFGQQDLLWQVAEPRAEYDAIASRIKEINASPDKNIEDIERMTEQFHRLFVSPEYQHQQRVADAWCAAFVWPKTTEAPAEVITTGTIRRLETDSEALTRDQCDEIERLAGRYLFFHWHLAFPEVYAQGGFDCVLGNPPWEKLQTEELQFFGARSAAIAKLKGAKRKQAIAALKESDPQLDADWQKQLRFDAAMIAFIRNSNIYPLTGVGKFNSYALFAELSSKLMSSLGAVGCIVPSNIATDDTTKLFFQSLVTHKSLASLYDFENKEGLFDGVHRSFKFCLLTFTGEARANDVGAQFLFFAREIDDLQNRKKLFKLSASDFEVLNPNTLNCPTFRSHPDAVLTLAMYRRSPIFLNERNAILNSYKPRVWRVFNTTDDSLYFAEYEHLNDSELVPIVEAKTIHQFDHRYATYQQVNEQNITVSHLSNEHKSSAYTYSKARFLVQESLFNERLPNEFRNKNWFLTIRNITHSTNERTAIGAIIPRSASCEVTPYVEIEGGASAAAFLTSLINSFVLDYVTRQKVGGTHLSYFILYQLPVYFPDDFESSSSKYCIQRVLELSYTAWDLRHFAQECGWDGPPFRWDVERRFLLRCELDAACFHHYLPADENGEWQPAMKRDGCPHDETPDQLEELKSLFPFPRDAVEYIMDTFPIVRRRDEEKFGQFRTKRMVLKNYDAMQENIRSGQPFESRLDPLPGPPVDPSGRFVRYEDIANNPPPHIHLPRDASTIDSIDLQLSDLGQQFPSSPFILRLGTSTEAKRIRVRPVAFDEVKSGDTIVLTCSGLELHGAVVPAVMGKLRVESRIDASSDNPYVLISIRGDQGVAQARLSEPDWISLTSIGLVEELT